MPIISTDAAAAGVCAELLETLDSSQGTQDGAIAALATSDAAQAQQLLRKSN
jgi:hypothetical protein